MRWLTAIGVRKILKNDFYLFGFWKCLLEYNGGNPLYGGLAYVFTDIFSGYGNYETIVIHMKA